MRIRVYHADLNPAIDPPSFKQSQSRADEIVACGQGSYFTLENGRAAIRLFRKRASREQWIERFEETTRSSSSAPMGYLKFIPPDSCGCGGASHGRCGLIAAS